MTKIVVESGMVFNLGGYLVEAIVKPDYVDVVVGNPLKEDVKIDSPILDKKMLDDIVEKGLIVEYIYKGDSLREKLEQVKGKVDEALGESSG